MKFNKTLQFLSLIALLALAACKGNPKDMLVKKWELDISETKKSLMAQVEKMKKENPEMGKLMEEGMKNFDSEAAKMKMTLEFKKDGTAETNFGGMKEEGKWTLSEDGKKITMEEKGGKKSDAEVVELSKSKLVLKMGSGNEAQTLAFAAAK
jgi:predicted HNH restriction endonuclease